MRNDTARWPEPRSSELIELDGLTITPVTLDRQVLVSGTNALSKETLPLVTWPEVESAASYALAVRRDRVLRVNGPAVIDGWDEDAELAISDVSDGYRVFDIRCHDMDALLGYGGEVALSLPSRSVARLWFGFGTFIYRINENVLRIHVVDYQADAMIDALVSALIKS
ncbi:hypothetical protein F9L33_13095 [Amylibacter sp. SFDW26]|uniref:hypothetical protein n=1 Tax=Amylibacter sp. SFDW26 TaxID=2652722 RepID=UPI001261F626|nr:hypothetical protein [Amylibacter sp. SFDW26]KAB7613520.1 hypothetical protein F9L33_13095 [Amylibacter sp. SFDW26]